MTFSENNLFFKEEEIQWEIVGQGVQRQIICYDESIMMVKVKFEKDSIGPLHQHPHTQVSHIDEGVFQVTIENETKVLKKGDSFFIPSNKLHGVVCLASGILIDVFSPMREDFIKADYHEDLKQ